jgi:hypothetical protein
MKPVAAGLRPGSSKLESLPALKFKQQRGKESAEKNKQERNQT